MPFGRIHSATLSGSSHASKSSSALASIARRTMTRVGVVLAAALVPWLGRAFALLSGVTFDVARGVAFGVAFGFACPAFGFGFVFGCALCALPGPFLIEFSSRFFLRAHVCVRRTTRGPRAARSRIRGSAR